MAKRYFIKKRKPLQTKLRHNLLCILLPAYLTLVVVILAACLLTTLLCRDNAIILYVAVFGMATLILAVSLCVVLAIIPAMRSKQAEEDIKLYDFAPYSPTDCESFSYKVQTERYYFIASPFDEDETITFDGSQALHEYFEQFSPDRFLGIEYLGRTGEFAPFFIFDFADCDLLNRTVEKKVDGDKIIVTITVNYDIEFTPDGVKAVGRTYPYSDLQASANAMFTGYATSARIFLMCSDALVASFAFGGKIVSLLDKYSIAVENKHVLDYILADPAKAFKRTARQRRLSISSKN